LTLQIGNIFLKLEKPFDEGPYCRCSDHSFTLFFPDSHFIEQIDLKMKIVAKLFTVIGQRITHKK
jgi:hypothetical protein